MGICELEGMMSEEEYNRLMRICVLKSINADLMTAEELHAKLQKGYDDALAGRTQDAASAFSRFRETQAENK